MIERAQAWLLRVLKVPPQPAPPAGAPGSLQIFRAGKNFLRLKLAAWTLTQIGAIIGLIFSLYFIQEVEVQIQMEKARELHEEAKDTPEAKQRPNLKEVKPDVYETDVPKSLPAGWSTEEDMGRNVVHQVFHNVAPEWMHRIARRTPERVLWWIKFAELVGLVFFVVQFCWSLVAVWLDYTQRWYMVTDRSLRLRSGLLGIQEATMSFANLQQVSVHQGPLQRLLNLADVHVESAGGGAGQEHGSEGDSMHRSSFHAVENAIEIRDLILARLQRFRQAGLGEPDDVNSSAVEGEGGTESQVTGSGDWPGDPAVLAAANEVLAEVKALRESIQA
jgi:membrane protein YdbS with pleckstrin-like domain